MRDVDRSKLREFETWLSLLADGQLPDRHKWKAWFCVAEYGPADFDRIATTLREHGGGGSFAFLGRDAVEQAEVMERLHADGHEIVFHSHRHHRYADLSYDEAHDAISRGMAAIEDATGIRPDGFFAPFLRLSDGSVRAIEEVGFDWVLGTTNRNADAVEIVEPVTPFDTRLLESNPPAEAMARLRDDADAGHAPFLFHPPVLEYYGALEAIEGWVSAVSPVTVAEQLENGGHGVVLDCVRPVRVE